MMHSSHGSMMVNRANNRAEHSGRCLSVVTVDVRGVTIHKSRFGTYLGFYVTVRYSRVKIIFLLTKFLFI